MQAKMQTQIEMSEIIDENVTAVEKTREQDSRI